MIYGPNINVKVLVINTSNATNSDWFHIFNVICEPHYRLVAWKLQMRISPQFILVGPQSCPYFRKTFSWYSNFVLDWCTWKENDEMGFAWDFQYPWTLYGIVPQIQDLGQHGLQIPEFTCSPVFCKRSIPTHISTLRVICLVLVNIGKLRMREENSTCDK